MATPFIAYRSSRALRGLGVTADAAGDVTGYARAIYQAVRGDVVGGGYSAALVFAGPIAAIGSAIAGFLNKSGKIKSSATSAFVEALGQVPGWTRIGGRVPMLITPGTPQCYSLRIDEYARAVSEAIRKGDSPAAVESAMRAWLATKKPWYGTCTVLPAPTPVSTPAPIIAPSAPVSAVPTSVAPSVASTPIVLPSTEILPATLITLPPTPDAPRAVVVKSPASVPPDQTPALIAQLKAQGASSQQAFTAALQSLAARGVPASRPVQQLVSRDVAASPRVSSPWIFAGFAALLGFALLVRRFT